MVFLEDGVRVVVVIEIAVVEGDDDGFLWKRPLALPGIYHLRGRDGRIAFLSEILHLRLELLGIDRQGVMLSVVDLVIVEDGDTALCLLEQGGDAEQQQDDEERAQREERFPFFLQQEHILFKAAGKYTGMPPLACLIIRPNILHCPLPVKKSGI